MSKKESNPIPKDAIKPPPPPGPPSQSQNQILNSSQKSSVFKVIDNRTNKEIMGAFVLLPEHDSAARTALAAYAEATNKPKIARWIRAWLMNIHRKRLKGRDIEPK